jgi:hypothetical protein
VVLLVDVVCMWVEPHDALVVWVNGAWPERNGTSVYASIRDNVHGRNRERVVSRCPPPVVPFVLPSLW